MSSASNPYLLNPFKSVWLQHINQGGQEVTFGFLKQLTCVKNTFGLWYSNVGKTNTKGISYTYMEPKTADYKGQVIVIYDVPNHSKPSECLKKNDSLKRVLIKQYPGFRCNLVHFKNSNDYLKSVLSKSSRYKIEQRTKKLEATYKISYNVFFGDMEEAEYQTLFSEFYTLLQKRFLVKKERNNNLSPKEWEFYRQVSLPMIKAKQAALLVIYNQSKPIAITLLNMSDTVMYDVLRVFDTDYATYGLGFIGIVKQLDWCFENNYCILDFSKGYYPYKQHVTNEDYWLEYHVYYDSKSFKATVIARILQAFFKFKYLLRTFNVNNSLVKFHFYKEKISFKTK